MDTESKLGAAPGLAIAALVTINAQGSSSGFEHRSLSAAAMFL
jgi:hypothetical protein